MALPILDGNQSATTLSTILSSGQHITAHTVVSLGTQAITDIVNATSAGLTNTQLRASAVTVSGTVTVGNSLTIGSLPAISGTVTANVFGKNVNAESFSQLPIIAFDENVEANPQAKVIPVQLTTDQGTIAGGNPLPISGTVTANLPDGALNVAGIATDEGSGQPNYGVQLGYFDAITDSYLLVKPSNPLPISGTVTANTFAVQGTAVTTSNFTSITPSTVLASFNATREVLTIFNEGAGNLHICAGATCTTIAYQVRLSSGDYYEVPNHQTSLTHSAVFATAGTARVTQVS
jgi:hypothetical protein